MKVIVLLLLIVFGLSKNLRNLDDYDWDKVHNELILKHNIARAKHNATALTKLNDIAELCKETLEGCVNRGGLYHSGFYYNGQGLGQNLYIESGRASADNIFNSWYSEGERYDYEKGNSALHFTQIVWKETKQIGCAYQVGPWKNFPNAYYVCCNYFPEGNRYGHFIENVQKPIE